MTQMCRATELSSLGICLQFIKAGCVFLPVGYFTTDSLLSLLTDPGNESGGTHLPFALQFSCFHIEIRKRL